jgi:hypothetical protein
LKNLLSNVFQFLDRDHNNYLTSEDFSEEERGSSKPTLLHSNSIGNSNNNDSASLFNRENSSSGQLLLQSPKLNEGKGMSISEPSSSSQIKKKEFLVFSPHQKRRKSNPIGSSSQIVFETTPTLSSSIPLQKSDSLWLSVSNEKSLPIR